MQKQNIIKDDGRYLIYYTFPNAEVVSGRDSGKAGVSGDAGGGAAPNPPATAPLVPPESGADPATARAGI